MHADRWQSPGNLQYDQRVHHPSREARRMFITCRTSSRLEVQRALIPPHFREGFLRKGHSEPASCAPPRSFSCSRASLRLSMCLVLPYRGSFALCTEALPRENRRGRSHRANFAPFKLRQGCAAVLRDEASRERRRTRAFLSLRPFHLSAEGGQRRRKRGTEKLLQVRPA
ncbi:hypothetical protein BV20DRAFT_131706 [Pilatotrama ljubarskyi]|nr:hypothetical protein BV20DRAFT_131706 [Pilatotrama ljubarskyi]